MTDEQRRTLEAWVRATNTPQGVALRAKIVLAAADGTANHRIGKDLGSAGPPWCCGGAVSRRAASTP